MPKNSVKPETAEPTNETASSNPGDQNDLTAYTEQTSLGGPIFKIGTYGPMPCRLQLSSKILQASGLKPRDQVQLIAEEGQIIIRKIGDPRQGYSIPSSKPRPELDEFLADMKKRSNPPGWGDEGEESEGSDEPKRMADNLSAEQVSREEL